ncbi:MAG: ATP-binding protein [Flavobacteriaceae bacterium]
MSPKRIVITGGPGTGKTSLVRHLEEDGFLCYHEIIRDLTSEAINGVDTVSFESNPLVFVDDPYQFNQRILNGRLDQFQKATMAPESVVFFDRGLPDVLAYMDYFDQSYGPDFIAACKDNRYDTVVILPPWEGIYQSDEERFESFEQASAIHLELVKTYTSFDYNPVNLPFGTLQERSSFVTDLIKSIL